MSQDKQLEGSIAFITGGASGIGRGIAERYIYEGANVVIFDLNTPLLCEVKKIFGDTCITIEGDVSKEADLQYGMNKCIEHFGRLDIGINTAGLSGYAYITEQTEEEWDTVMDTCLKGVFLSMKHESRQMLAQGEGGVIINIASLNARQAAEGYSAYCSAKAGVEMITRVGAMELGPHKIRVCGISPGFVYTPLVADYMDYPSLGEETLDNIPLGRLGTADDIAGVAVFLASEDASWITGDTLFVDGGCHTKRYPILSNHIPELRMLMSKAK